MTLISLPERSYGIIPIAQTPSGFEFLLIQQTQGHWTFPKGHKAWGEIPIETAKRELREETGVSEVYVDQDATFETYYTHDEGLITRRKTVLFFPGFIQKGSIKMQEAEIIDYAWVSFQKAKELLKYPDMKEMMDKVHSYLVSTGAQRA